MSTAPAEHGTVEAEARSQSYFVLDDEDRITHIRTELQDGVDPFIGQVVWARLPGAEPLLRHTFDEARRTGRSVDFTVFYAGRTTRILAVPAADGLAVHVEQLTALDVRTLGTLAESLRQIEAELAARESEPRDPRAPSSLQALL